MLPKGWVNKTSPFFCSCAIMVVTRGDDDGSAESNKGDRIER